MGKLPAHVKSQYSGKTYAVGEYESVYNQGLDEGFSISTAKEYVQDVPGHEELLAVTLDTPYYYKGKSLTAYAVIDMSDERRDHDTAAVRPFNTCELYSSGCNIEDIHSFEKPSKRDHLYVDSPDGVIPYEEALDKVGMFSQAASFYPHVMDYDEYESVFNKTHEKSISDGIIQPASEDGYDRYLDGVKNLMHDGLTYIGETTEPEDVDIRRFTMPSADIMNYASESDSKNNSQSEQSDGFQEYLRGFETIVDIDDYPDDDDNDLRGFETILDIDDYPDDDNISLT